MIQISSDLLEGGSVLEVPYHFGDGSEFSQVYVDIDTNLPQEGSTCGGLFLEGGAEFMIHSYTMSFENSLKTMRADH